MDNMEYFRQQMFQNASVHGGVQTKPEAAPVETADTVDEKMKKALIVIGISDPAIGADPIMRMLFEMFLPQAKTDDGRAKAAALAVSISKKLREKFTIVTGEAGHDVDEFYKDERPS